MAEQYSEDKARQGGNLGWQTRGQMVGHHYHHHCHLHHCHCHHHHHRCYVVLIGGHLGCHHHGHFLIIIIFLAIIIKVMIIITHHD